MIRFIFKTVVHNEDLMIHEESFKTFDLSIPEIEKILLSRGVGNGSYDQTNLIGIELIEAAEKEKRS